MNCEYIKCDRPATKVLMNTRLCESCYVTVQEHIQHDVTLVSKMAVETTPSGRRPGQGRKPVCSTPIFDYLDRSRGQEIRTTDITRKVHISFPTVKKRLEMFEERGIVKSKGKGVWYVYRKTRRIESL